jgi:hypothetical protein
VTLPLPIAANERNDDTAPARPNEPVPVVFVVSFTPSARTRAMYQVP